MSESKLPSTPSAEAALFSAFNTRMRFKELTELISSFASGPLDLNACREPSAVDSTLDHKMTLLMAAFYYDLNRIEYRYVQSSADLVVPVLLQQPAWRAALDINKTDGQGRNAALLIIEQIQTNHMAGYGTTKFLSYFLPIFLGFPSLDLKGVADKLPFCPDSVLEFVLQHPNFQSSELDFNSHLLSVLRCFGKSSAYNRGRSIPVPKEQITRVLKLGADSNYVSPETGECVFDVAIASGVPADVFEQLRQHGIKTRVDSSLLLSAVKSSQYPSVLLLLSDPAAVALDRSTLESAYQLALKIESCEQRPRQTPYLIVQLLECALHASLLSSKPVLDDLFGKDCGSLVYSYLGTPNPEFNHLLSGYEDLGKRNQTYFVAAALHLACRTMTEYYSMKLVKDTGAPRMSLNSILYPWINLCEDVFTLGVDLSRWFNVRDPAGFTLFMQLVMADESMELESEKSFVELALKAPTSNQIEVNARNGRDNGFTAIHYAVLGSHSTYRLTTVLKALLSAPNVDVNVTCDAGLTAYSHLLKSFAPKMATEPDYNITPFSLPDSLLNSALMLVTHPSFSIAVHPGALATLLRTVSKFDSISWETVADIAEALLQRGDDANWHDADCEYPILSLVRNEAFQGQIIEHDLVPSFKSQPPHSILSLLLDYGADPNVTDQDGNTALHLAVETGCLGFATLLLENKSTDRSAKNAQGVTAIELAQNNEDEDMLSVFEEAS